MVFIYQKDTSFSCWCQILNPQLSIISPIYEYGDDIPDVCFFGADARWNGDKVTSGDWFKLTDFLKSMFIIEGSDKLGYDELNGWAVLDEMNQIATDTLKPILMESALKVILLRDYKPKA